MSDELPSQVPPAVPPQIPRKASAQVPSRQGVRRDRPRSGGSLRSLGSRAAGFGRELLASAASDRITTNAASLAFHWFLAVFPAALALLGLAHLVGLSPAQVRALAHGIGALLPAAAAQVLVEALRSPSSAKASLLEVLLGTLVATWSAIEAMAALQVGLDVAFAVRRDRGFIRRRVASLPLLGVTVVLGGSAFALMVLGVPLGHLISGSLPAGRQAFSVVWNLARFVGAFVLVALLVSTYYALGPWRERRRWRWLTPGSALATLGWLASSGAYSFYLDDVGHASRTYGAFAGVAALLLWLFLTAVCLLAGAELDRALESRDAQPVKRPSG